MLQSLASRFESSSLGSSTRQVLQHSRAWEMFKMEWHLGFTAFGGPPVHFKIFHDKFVKKAKWIDEQMYQELFSISQALSGPGSTKMLYCINLIHGGKITAILGLLLWSMPMAFAMYGLSIGVSSINDRLPAPAYALLSGLNAATVGVIALAAVELSQKAITDHLSRILIFLVASAGLLYNALWYFPVLMVAAGLAALINDYRIIHRPINYLFSRRRQPQPPVADEAGPEQSTTEDEPRVIPQPLRLNISWKVGTMIILAFLTTFIIVMVLRGTLTFPPLLFRLFANMYLAGTIIFGGGPVVVPLLREYVVAEGWVSQRDFLIGLALVQALPGPNFNFAVFLGSLTAVGGGYNSFAGAMLAWLGIFAPGIVLVHGTMGIWTALRNRRWVKSILRGINAGAVGLIYTAVYRIWQSGYLGENFQSGRSLGDDPWWIIVAAGSYLGGFWFNLPAAMAIVSGAVLGLIRYGVVRS